jgi:tetratricopeptide (TPR) repeat protein
MSFISSLSQNLKNNRWYHIGLLIILPCIIYLQAVTFEYTNFDDNGIILQKFDVVKNIKNIDTTLVTDAFWNSNGDFYRPVQNISFMLDAQVSGSDLWMFHTTNLLIHILTSISLYFFLQFLYLKRYTAFLLAVLFAVHPLFASGVGWIPSRGDILIGLFGIQLFITFGLYFRTKKIIWFILHALLFLITIFTKETTVLFPLFFIYYYFFVLRKNEPFIEGAEPESKFKKLKKAFVRMLPFFICWASFFVLYYVLRKKVVANTGATADVLGIIPFFKNNTVIPTIIGKFFVPINLSTFPLYDNITTIIGIVFLLVLLYLTFEYTIGKKWAALMGLLWFLLFAIPPTIYRLENADTFFNYLEHRTYLPMIGIIIIIGFFIDDHFSSAAFSKRFMWVYIPVILIFSVLAFIHCADYKNNFSLANRAAKLNNPSGLSMRAGNYIERKDTVNALADINKAIELSPNNANMYFMRGKIRAKMMQHESAENDFTLTLTLNAGLVDAYVARSVERRYLKKYESAFRDIYTAIKYDSANPRWYFSAGNLFVAVNNYSEAANAYSQAIKIQPQYSEAYNNRGYARLMMKDYNGTLDDCYKAIQLKVRSPYVYNNLATAYRELNQLDSAFANYNKAISMDKSFAQAYYEKGKAWQKINATSSACKDWTTALNLGYAGSKEMLDKYCK